MLASRAELRYTERCLRSYGDARAAAAIKDLGVSPSGPRSPPQPQAASAAIPDAARGDREYTYASKQATNCAGCGKHKHTPLRIDAMGGYVCLTCIDQKLGSMLGEFGYPADPHSDAALLDLVASEYLNLESFAMPTGQGDADVGWRTIQHHEGKNSARVASEVYADDPRQAIREAMERLERDPFCTGPLHIEDAA
jgi:hypothetical protein